jgi:hypothetical protein
MEVVIAQWATTRDTESFISEKWRTSFVLRDLRRSEVPAGGSSATSSPNRAPAPGPFYFWTKAFAGGALTERTIDAGFGGLVRTPQYMSPEQATFNNLDIDTRSDV